MSDKPDYYELVAVRSSKDPFQLYTAALIVCSLCGEMIDGMGGPGHGAVCVKCAPEMIAGRLRGCVIWGEQKTSISASPNVNGDEA